jgi:hypothetical protein
MREIRMSGSMRGGRKRAFARRACLLLYRVPRKQSSFAIDSFRPFRSENRCPLFRRTHVSALNFCMSLFRQSGVAIIIQPHWASCITALTRASTKEPAAHCAVRDKPPVW